MPVLPKFLPFRLLPALFALLSSLPVLATNFWQPLCPDGAVCSTANRAFVADGHVLLKTDDFDTPFRWVNLATLGAAPTTMEATVATNTGHYLYAYGPSFVVYDTAGNKLASYNHSSIELYIVFESHATGLGPALYFTGTTAPTVLSGLTVTNSLPLIYLSQDEGLSMTLQTANVLMQGGRRSFASGADGTRVWVNPGPATPGLWQTPAIAGAAKLDFTKLTRLDDGSYPADTTQFKVVPAGAGLPGGYAVALSNAGMFVSTNLGVTWTHGGFDGPVSDIVFPEPANPDVQVIAAQGTIWLSRNRGGTWQQMGHDLTADTFTLTATAGGIVADGVGGVFWCSGLDCFGPAYGQIASINPGHARVTEFQNTILGHFFMTGDESEKTAIRNGLAGPGWVETGQNFWAWTPTVTQESAFVCRFYGDPVKGPNSHFYSASTDECRGLLNLQESTPVSQPRWNSEGYAFKVSLPDRPNHCRGDNLPVYRAYNNGFSHGIDSNHRYALDRALLQPLVAQGWTEEGLVFCVPPTGS